MEKPYLNTPSPWGTVIHVERQADGIYCVETLRHGGYWLDEQRLESMPAYLKAPSTYYPSISPEWFEQDVEWFRVVLAFPYAFELVGRPTSALISMALDVMHAFHPEIAHEYTERNPL